MKINRNLTKLTFFSALLVLNILVSCGGKSVKKGVLISTEALGNIDTPDFINGDSSRFPEKTRIVAFNPERPSSSRILTGDFYSACFPKISFDGRSILFSAQLKQGEPWQIWEMDLKNLDSRRITSTDHNCTDPAYLPDGRIVFSKFTVNDTIKKAHCLYTCNSDGSDLKQITFGPQSNFGTTVLKDGRLLTVNRQVIPRNTDPVLIVMRPDGTKADLFYRSTPGSTILSPAVEDDNGKLFFIESEKEKPFKPDVIAINYNRPLHSRTNITSDIEGNFSHVLPLKNGNCLVSYRKSSSDLYSIYEFDLVKKMPGQKVFSDPEYNILDIIAVGESVKPKKLPSEVDLKVKTGLLLCQDINLLNHSAGDNSSDHPKADRIEILGIDSTYGVVQVEKDGSFFLKVMSDIPFQIRTLDDKGNIINGPCSWLWLRPNERRGCVGCHQDPELVPENRVSLAVKKSPVIIPVHITKVTEKIIELE
jgi:hypothetical protein